MSTPGLAVDGAEPHRDTLSRESLLKAQQKFHDGRGARNRTWTGGRLAATVRGPAGVGREEPQQALLVSCFDGGHERVEQPLARLFSGVEPLLLAADAAARAMNDLARRRFALAEERGDFRVAAVEHVVQQERRPFFGRQPLEQHEERDRQVGGQLDVPIGRSRRRADQRLGSHGPSYASRSTLRAAQPVDRHARGRGHQPGLGIAYRRFVGLVPAT
jgi:hypothetical protein